MGVHRLRETVTLKMPDRFEGLCDVGHTSLTQGSKIAADQ
jgi:hypothetical protein